MSLSQGVKFEGLSGFVIVQVASSLNTGFMSELTESKDGCKVQLLVEIHIGQVTTSHLITVRPLLRLRTVSVRVLE